MTQKIVVGPFNRGFRNDIPPFYVDNDSFPTLINAYQWRARVKRKRGNSPIARLERNFDSSIFSFGFPPFPSSFNLVGGAGNLFSGNLPSNSFNLNNVQNVPPNTGSIVPSNVPQGGSYFVQFTVAGQVYTDKQADGTLQGSLGGTGTINYATGDITILGGGGSAVTLATFSYFPDLPVMGLRALTLSAIQFPQTLAFDTTFAYQITQSFPYFAFDVSFYKNPPAGTFPGYIPKTTPTPVRWNGKNYQQFWTTNYENALWATNGITVPFTTTNIGMQFKKVTNISAVVGGPPAMATFTIGAPNGLVVGDFVFFNEFATTGLTAVTGLNLQTGYVIAVGVGTITVEFPDAVLTGAGGAQSQGIVQYLTSNLADPTLDTLRWYDGSPVFGNQFTTTFLTSGLGWVNFNPPIYSAPSEIGTIGDLPPGIYYLVGARMIVPYKDRLLFLGAVVQCTGSISGQIAGVYYLQDTIIFSQNGTPYYTASFQGSPLAPNPIIPVLTPTIPQAMSTFQAALPSAYFVDVAGFGGFITAGYSQPLTTVGYNQDVLIIGFTTRQTKLLYTGNDLFPFNFFIVNSELGATSTFSSIVLDRGVISIGDRGITLTDQQSCQRIDLEILDQIFEFDLINNGTERITSQRDFVSEWIYFSYPFDNEENDATPFPNQTLFYNYRNGSWAIFNESFTSYGPFRALTGFSWQTIGTEFSSWNAWNVPWNDSDSSLQQPQVIAGNQQGFVVARGGLEDNTTSESPSLFITAFNPATMTVTSPNHGLNTGDFVYFTGAIGLSNFNSNTNGTPSTLLVFEITVIDVNNFTIAGDPLLPVPIIPSGTYVGNGVITRLFVPQIQSRQFPTAWALGRKTRIGTQQYLFSTTANGQITLQLFLSQNASTPFNDPPFVPDPNAPNNSVVYSDTLFTCQESENIGLTPANINLQQLVPAQAQTWHRMNTSLIGDTVQVGFTLYPEQMFGLFPGTTAFAITGATQANPCVLTCSGQFAANSYVLIQNVVGMIELNSSIFQVILSTPTTVTINVDSTAFTAYSSGGTATQVTPVQASISEIELHGMILDVSPSQILS